MQDMIVGRAVRATHSSDPGVEVTVEFTSRNAVTYITRFHGREAMRRLMPREAGVELLQSFEAMGAEMVWEG